MEQSFSQQHQGLMGTGTCRFSGRGPDPLQQMLELGPRSRAVETHAQVGGVPVQREEEEGKVSEVLTLVIRGWRLVREQQGGKAGLGDTAANVSADGAPWRNVRLAHRAPGKGPGLRMKTGSTPTTGKADTCSQQLLREDG